MTVIVHRVYRHKVMMTIGGPFRGARKQRRLKMTGRLAGDQILHQTTLVPTGRLGGILGFFNLSNHLFERLGYIDIEPGTGFGEPTFELLGHLPPFLRRNVPLLRLEVTLISNNHHWNPISALYS